MVSPRSWVLVALSFLVTSDLHASTTTVPFALNGSRIPVGTWARYRTAYFGGNGVQDVRIALVQRRGATATWETTRLMPDGQPTTLQFTVDESKDHHGRVLSRVVSLADRSLMTVPADREQAFVRASSTAARRSEKIRVPAGTFTTRRYTNEREPGAGFDLWTSARVWPTGVVRFEEWTRGGNGVRLVQRTWELIEQGRGARSELRGTPRPFDPQTLNRSLKP